jgi:hypothetical protein
LAAKHRRKRYVRSWNDEEGAGHVHARGPADAIARIMARINAERDRIFRAAHKDGTEEPAEAYAFDALERICAGETRTGAVQSKVIVRVDLDSLLRGVAAEGETCEVTGVPVAVSIVDDILRSGSAFLAAVVTKSQRLVGFVHFGRRPTAGQQTGLEWIYPTCAAHGCGRSARLERDHRADWAQTKITAFEFLDLLCPFHHRLKTTEGWQLVDGHGKREFVPPADPRHPQHAPPSAA